ncbi:MAG TPA: hypothetical protein VNQ79_15820 [Blastocatellia bacterium]|nr:hypothetical protein [Blastocatellia bacterium]
MNVSLVVEIAGLLLSTLVTVGTVVALISRLRTRMETVEQDVQKILQREQSRDDRLSRHIEDTERHVDERSWNELTARMERIESLLISAIQQGQVGH